MTPNIQERVRRGGEGGGAIHRPSLSGAAASVAGEATPASDTIAAEVATAAPRFGPVVRPGDRDDPTRPKRRPCRCSVVYGG